MRWNLRLLAAISLLALLVLPASEAAAVCDPIYGEGCWQCYCLELFGIIINCTCLESGEIGRACCYDYGGAGCQVRGAFCDSIIVTP